MAHGDEITKIGKVFRITERYMFGIGRVYIIDDATLVIFEFESAFVFVSRSRGHCNHMEIRHDLFELLRKPGPRKAHLDTMFRIRLGVQKRKVSISGRRSTQRATSRPALM